MLSDKFFKHRKRILSMRPTSRKLITVVILSVFIILACAYSLIAPTFEGPDENVHYRYVKSLLDSTLPRSEYLRSPPLYYAMAAGLLYFINHPEKIEVTPRTKKRKGINRFRHRHEEIFPFSGTARAVHLLRLLSVVTGFFTLLVFYRIYRLVFADSPALTLTALSISAFLPKFTWMNSVMNNDSLVWLLSALAIYFLIRFVQTENQIKYLACSGFVTGLAIYTKVNALVIPFSVILFIFYYRKFALKSLLREGGVFCALTFIGGGWYLFHRIYLGINPDNLHFTSIFKLFTNASTAASIKYVDTATGFSRLLNGDFLYQRLIQMCWSYLGWHNITGPVFYDYIYSAVLVLALTGLVASIFRHSDNKQIIPDKHIRVFFIIMAIAMTVAMLVYMYENGSGDARYMFPALPAFVVLLLEGLSFYLNKQWKWLLAFLPVLMLLNNMALVKNMAKSYKHGFRKLMITEELRTTSSMYESPVKKVVIICMPFAAMSYPNTAIMLHTATG
ncbi:MAG: hypothetical protein D6719_08930 [Candidatus Dadabacteria bacterium]|nr:MAG: hypothetical protein D6719_08930 [Candidatus Dadabacteria bacterium]